MCGIIYAKRKDKMPIGKGVLKRFHKQRARGTEGFGFITVDNGKVTGVHRFEKEADATKALGECKSSHVLFHHRTPTSTPNYRDMTHPIVVKNKLLDKDYYVVHNGVLQNEHDLRTKHMEMGFKYTTDMKLISAVETASGRSETVIEKFNDSEALAIELALFLDGKKDTIDAIGSIAFVCLETDKKGNLLNTHYGRNAGNPLVIEDNNDLFFVKSTGDGFKVNEDELLTINFSTGEKTFRAVEIGRRFHVPVKHEHTAFTGFGGYDDDSYFPAKRTIGFHANDRDRYEPILSPFQRGNLRLGAGSDDDRVLTPTQQEIVDNMEAAGEDYEWQESFDSYKLTDEYLLELWAEIESLETEICDINKSQKDGSLQDSEDIIYNAERIDESIAVLTEKKVEAEKLHHYLKLKDAKEKKSTGK